MPAYFALIYPAEKVFNDIVLMIFINFTDL